jgi:16S rRNA processing protein RimM
LTDLRIGVITSPHGLKGEVKVFPTTDNPKVYEHGLRVVLQNSNISNQHELRIESCRSFKKFLIVKFMGVERIEDIEGYKGYGIWIDRKDAVQPEEGEYFVADLIGLSVFADEGNYLGTLREVYSTGANDVYAIEGESGEILLPAIKECIKEVNIPEGKMIVHLMKGLL